jgi:DNA-binding transcriptional LysR family regulator
VRDGRLVRLLPDLRLRPIETYAIWPNTINDTSPARLLLDFWTEQMPKGR